MANLNFKFGEYKNLSSVEPSAITEGTIYVTTDEKAIYVDLGQKRLRLGDIIVRDSISEAKPPFTENAFYYFSAENALCRYTPKGWKQLNNTTDLKNAIDANTNSITALTKTVGTNTTNIDGLTTRMGAAESNIKEAQKQADKGVADAATAQSTANTNKDNLQSLTEKVNGIDSSLTATKSTVKTHGTDISNIKKKDAAQDGRLDTLEKLISGETEGGNITAQLAALKAKDIALESEDERLAGLISGNTSAISAVKKTADTNKSTLDTYTPKVDKAETDISALQGTVRTHTTNISALQQKDTELVAKDTELAGDIAKNTSAISAVKTTADKNKTTLGTYTSKVDQAETDIDVLQTAVGTNTLGQETGIYKDIADLKAKDADLASEDLKLSNSISTNTQSINSLDERLATAEGNINGLTSTTENHTTRLEEVEDKATANAENITKLQQEDITIKNDIKTNVSGIATNLAEINKLKSAIDNSTGLGKKLTDLTGRVTTAESEINALQTLTTKHGESISSLDVLTKNHTTQINNNTSTIASNATNITTNTNAITGIKNTIGKDGEQGQSTGLYKAIDDKINSALQAADAMTFKGVVNSDADFGTKYKEYHAGDTYKVAVDATFTLAPGSTQKCYIGDLLIVKEDGQKTFHYVPSGGQDHENLKFTTANNVIKVSDDIHPNMGQVTLKSENACLTIKSSGTVNDATIAFNFVWGTF